MKSGFRATRSPFVNILAFFNVVASRQISPHRSCKGTMFIHICKIFFNRVSQSVAGVEFLNKWVTGVWFLNYWVPGVEFLNKLAG